MRFLNGKSSIRANGIHGADVVLMVAIVATFVFTWGFSPSEGLANDGIASNAIVHRAGLKVQWFTHSGTAATSRLVDWDLNINENKATTFYTITAGNFRETFSQNRVGPFAKKMTADEAVEYAEIRKEILMAELAAAGRKDVEVKIGQYTLPETTIYVLTSRGIIKAIDGDTGATKWSSRIGSTTLPSIGLGSNGEYIAAINGSSLYCLSAETGKELWSQKCQYAVGSSPAVSDEKIYVPLLNGRMESFSIKDEGFASKAFVSEGEGTARPLVTEKTVSWPNSDGTMSVAAKYGRSGIAYQLQADAAIMSPVVFEKGLFYVTSLDGFVYAINEDRGNIVWQVSTGKSISQSPIPMGGFIFVINDENELYKYDARSGLEAPGWEKPRTGIHQFVGAGKDNLYVLDPVGSLNVISQDSGIVLSSVSLGDVDRVLPNYQSDRLYVASKQGMIQCVREIASPIPLFHSDEILAASEAASAAADSKVDPNAEPDTSDPFGDPFGDPIGDPKSGDSKDDPADGTDPFGGDDTSDPFGGDADSGGKTDDKSDPFGGDAPSGDADPFGG